MSESRKLNVGPLPEPVENVKQFEETEILWGRVIAFAVSAVLLISAVLVGVFGGDANDALVRISPVPSQVLSDAEQREPKAVVVPEAKEPNPQPEATEEVRPEDGSIETETTVAEVETAPVISPVTTLHEGMRRAELTLSLKNGQPTSPLEYQVPMSAEGIIKVILFTEMKGLKGTVLFHDWYREDKRMARVKIPVNVSEQSSYSSKFINRQMTGEWTVKVADQSGELYAQANFRVE